jgi:ribosomal protein S18 acetylase RimI-like enzyme
LARDIFIRPAVKSDNAALNRFLDLEHHVHRHLDWRTPTDWLESKPFWLLAYKDNTDSDFLAVLSCPPDPPEVSWIRLFAAAKTVNLNKAWRLLFEKAHQELKQNPEVNIIAAVALRDWFIDLLKENDFQQIENIVVLERESHPLTPLSLLHGIFLRPMLPVDLIAVEHVDKLSFAPLWQNSVAGLTQAYQQSTYATVAEYENKIVGYQISTESPYSAHLARLAVDPQLQRHHIGQALLRDMLDNYQKKRVSRMSVNTQGDNTASLNLYKKMGFRPNLESFPVFAYFPPTATNNPPAKR